MIIGRIQRNLRPTKMVAISLYRGNLHKVPDVPRLWVMPNPKISPKDFKLLLSRRSRALSRLRSSSAPAATTTTTSTSTSTKSKTETIQKNETLEVNALNNHGIQLEENKASGSGERPSRNNKDQKGSEGGHSYLEEINDGSDRILVSKPEASDKASIPVRNGDKPTQLIIPDAETSNKGGLAREKEKREREVEDKLRVLNAKKHNLVLVLKQILNAEEKLKRRNSMQCFASRPATELQADGTNDTGSMSRPLGSRMSSDANMGGDIEGGETDDLSNHKVQSRHTFRTSSISPSSESPLRRLASVQQNQVPLLNRATLGAAGSPSRFAPAGHQGNPANVPAVSVSGTSYVASSPSPAASVGTSVFREARHPSPWN